MSHVITSTFLCFNRGMYNGSNFVVAVATVACTMGPTGEYS